jgi:TolA-binding protein
LSAGFEVECERVPADDLTVLGDAARLSGDAERARMAYAALRRRFPGEVSAARAAFALGRLSFDVDPEAAARWFDIYLREQPVGPLAHAALDRLFELAVAGRDLERSRDVARRYLEGHPSGPHVRDASRVLRPEASGP